MEWVGGLDVEEYDSFYEVASDIAVFQSPADQKVFNRNREQRGIRRYHLSILGRV